MVAQALRNRVSLTSAMAVRGSRKVRAATVIINRDVPGNCTVVGAPGRIVKRDGSHTDEPLPVAHYQHGANRNA